MKNRTLLIVIGVILLCCCVVVIAAALAYPTIKNYLNSVSTGLNDLSPTAVWTPDPGDVTSSPSDVGSTSTPVDGGLDDPTLKGDVWNSILTAESGRGCNNVTSTAIDVAQQPDANRVWVEDWSATACGNQVVFEITFTPDTTNGGTNYDIKQK